MKSWSLRGHVGVDEKMREQIEAIKEIRTKPTVEYHAELVAQPLPVTMAWLI